MPDISLPVSRKMPLAMKPRSRSSSAVLSAPHFAAEKFSAKGLKVEDYGWLEVYVYEKWSDHELPDFTLDETFVPASLMMEEGKTVPPKPLTEADLIAKMDANGIGTDATIHEHIKTVQDR